MLHTSFSVNRSAFRKNTQLKNSVNKGDVFFKAAVIEIEVPLTSEIGRASCRERV